MARNAGLWDGFVALDWTRNYISYLGGNDEQVTITAEGLHWRKAKKCKQ